MVHAVAVSFPFAPAGKNIGLLPSAPPPLSEVYLAIIPNTLSVICFKPLSRRRLCEPEKRERVPATFWQRRQWLGAPRVHGWVDRVHILREERSE